MELTAKQIYASVDDWYTAKFNELGYVAPFVSVSALNDGITAYDYLLTPVAKGRITRAASALNPLLREYANNPNMTFDIDVLLRHMPAFKMEVFGKRYGFADQNADSPLTDPVAAWLAEILRPRNINHISDPISDVIAAAIEGTAWHDKTPAALVKQAATLLSTLHAYNKGQVPNAQIPTEKLLDLGHIQFSVGQAETTAERGFREALHRLVDASADPDPKVFAYVLLTEFGERLRLSNKVPHFTGVVERDTLAHVDSSGRHSVLWASTGDFIYRSVPSLGRELIDWQHPDNVAHLQACYNAHNTPLGDTHPCSHFTSRPH